MTSARRVRLDSLTGLRFVAALMVVLLHLGDAYAPIPGFKEATQLGGTAVSFFFVLSGFVLTWSAADLVPAARDFYARRFARIFPTHVVAWAYCLVMAALGLVVAGPPLAVGLNLVLLQSWAPHIQYFFSVNGPSWSISDEAFFYALFPYLLTRVRPLSRSRLLWLMAALYGAAGVIALVVQGGLPHQSVFLVYVLPAYRVWEFVVGIALACLLRTGAVLPLSRRTAVWLFVAAYAVCSVIGALLPHLGLGLSTFPQALADIAMAPFVAVALYSFAMADVAGVRTVMASRPAVVLGEWSFALYMLHLPTMYVLESVVGPAHSTVGAVARMLISVPLLIAVAGGFHHVVERPAERYLRRRLTGSRTERATAVVATAGQSD